VPIPEVNFWLNDIILTLIYGFFIFLFFLFTVFIASLLSLKVEEKIHKIKLMLFKKKRSILKIIFNILAALMYGILALFIIIMISYYALNIVVSNI